MRASIAYAKANLHTFSSDSTRPDQTKEVTRVTSKVAPNKKNKNRDSQLLEVFRLLASCLKSVAIIISAFF